MFKNLRTQLAPTIKLSIPIALTQMGQMTMNLVDIFMLGKLGPEAIGSAAVAHSLFFAIAIFASGLISALDFFISSSLGRKDEDEVKKWKVQGLYFSFIISLPLMALNLAVANNIHHFGVPENIAAGTREFSQIFCLSFFPFMVFFSQRQYLQTIGKAKIVTQTMVLGNILNIILNWLFIYGHLGFPAMGLRGSALSTTITRTILAIVLIAAAFYKTQNSFEFLPKFHIKLLKLGLPAGLQNLFEVGVFALSTNLASRLGTQSLAAHSIVLNIASFTFMVPLGVSLASAIRVGYFYGERKLEEARHAGNAAIFLGAATMAIFSLILASTGKLIIGLFTSDSEVIRLGFHIVLLAALFQIADGLQVVTTGALRGLGKTRAPAIANLFGHWFVGLPVGAYLCFYTPLKLEGLWMGLTLGLIVVAIILVAVWQRASRRYNH